MKAKEIIEDLKHEFDILNDLVKEEKSNKKKISKCKENIKRLRQELKEVNVNAE